MENQDKTRYEEQAKIIKALAHPSRLMIVDELNKEKRCVADLTQMVGVDTSTVSKHLSVLKNAGLVVDERQGTTIYYHLRMPCLMDFIQCVESVMESNALGQMETIISCKKR
ncbi:MAG: metalloregulator ArsR/SmtB family transcription factor [Proteobacteria bacterium]|nr:metalloregulator ArsR/SmtB family transcription factor [Pseudomonadota bacterium]